MKLCAPVGALSRRDSQLAIPQRHGCITRHTRRCRPVQIRQRIHTGRFVARIHRRTASSKGGASRPRRAGVWDSRVRGSRHSTACANRSAGVRWAKGSASGSCTLGWSTAASFLDWLNRWPSVAKKSVGTTLSRMFSRLACTRIVRGWLSVGNGVPCSSTSCSMGDDPEQLCHLSGGA